MRRKEGIFFKIRDGPLKSGKVGSYAHYAYREHNLHYITKNIGTPAFTRTWTLMVSQSLSVGFNIDLDHPLQREQLQLFLESCPQGLGECLLECLTILPVARLWGQALMLDEKAWLTISALIHPKGVHWSKSFGGGGIMVWGCFLGVGLGSFVAVKWTLKASAF